MLWCRDFVSSCEYLGWYLTFIFDFGFGWEHGPGGSDKPPGITPYEIRRLTVSQLWWLLWQVLAVLQEYQTAPDPWESTSHLPQAATGSSAHHSADQPSTSSAPPVPLLNPHTCRYRCVFCNSPCIREKAGHRHAYPEIYKQPSEQQIRTDHNQK